MFDIIYERIKELADKKGISINALEDKLNISRGSLCKIDKHKPSSEKVGKLAKELDTTSDYILTGNDFRTETPKFEKEHIELITLYSQLEKEQKEAVFTFLRSFCSK